MSSVSVIVPTYNRGALIGDTIVNLLKQTVPPYEIIIIDDGSTDESAKIVRSFGDNVKIIQQGNRGPGAARNAGLAAATGEYVQFQDSDDLLSLNKLEAQARELDRTGADIALGPWAHVRIIKRTVEFETCVLQQSLPPRHIALSSWLLRGWSTILQSMLFRRSFLAAIGKYRTDIRYGEDMEFFFRMLCQEPQATFAADTLTLHRVDTAGKLSHDTGLARHQRIMDWAKCLASISDKVRSSGLKTDVITRWIFLSAIRKQLRYLAKIPAAPSKLSESLTKETNRLPTACLAGVELWLRLVERLRLHRFGCRWMRGYQASPPAPQQIRLIKDLGFEISASRP